MLYLTSVNFSSPGESRTEPQRGDITQAGGGVRSTTLGKTDASIVLLSLNRSLPSTLARRRPERAKAHSLGQRPGLHDARGSPPCKGKSFYTYSAKNLMATQKPRAMPWAVSCCPFGASLGANLLNARSALNRCAAALNRRSSTEAVLSRKAWSTN